jgi:hypothetical protein
MKGKISIFGQPAVEKKESERNQGFIITELMADEVERGSWPQLAAGMEQQQRHQSRPKCPHCCREYSNVWNLKQHIVNVHVHTATEEWESCVMCGKKFKTRQYLTMHQYRVHGIKHREQNQSYIGPQTNRDTDAVVSLLL